MQKSKREIWRTENNSICRESRCLRRGCSDAKIADRGEPSQE
jgi:hypothetical protein